MQTTISGHTAKLNYQCPTVAQCTVCFSALLGSVWILLWGEIRPLWLWQGLVLLCHDASIAPYACLLPGPKTICCKLHYGLLRLICCLRTWCDWVSIHTTTLKLPASWPGHQQWQLQYRTVGATWSVSVLWRGNLLSALWSSTSPPKSLERKGQPSCCLNLSSQLLLQQPCVRQRLSCYLK